jgi:hypothetical protein
MEDVHHVAERVANVVKWLLRLSRLVRLLLRD